MLKSKFFAFSSGISLELHFVLCILSFSAQIFYFLTRCRYPKTDFYVKIGNFVEITNPGSNSNFRYDRIMYESSIQR